MGWDAVKPNQPIKSMGDTKIYSKDEREYKLSESIAHMYKWNSVLKNAKIKKGAEREPKQ